MFGIPVTLKGTIGIAIHRNSVAIGQCTWRRGEFVNPRVTCIDSNPRNVTAEDWSATIHAAGITGSTCCVALPSSILNHHVLQLPQMAGPELEEAVGWEIADRIGSDRDLLQIDAKRLGTGGDVLGVSIEQSTLAGMLDPLYRAGLRPTIIEPACFAITRILSMQHRRIADHSSVRAVLDFSNDDSSMMILAGDDIVFYKQLQYSGGALIDAVSTHVGVSELQASRMLEASNQNSDEAMSRAVRDASRTLHEQIARDAMKCLRHYGVTSRGPIPSELIVTGSAGWNRNLAEILESACNMSAIADWDIDYLKCVSNAHHTYLGWQTALGTSLSACSSVDRRRQSETKGGVAA